MGVLRTKGRQNCLSIVCWCIHVNEQLMTDLIELINI
jgi:hypothetical protein